MKTIKLMIAIVLIIASVGVSATELEVNIKKSTIKWTGKKIGGQHSGEIKLKNAILQIDNNIIRKGEFVIDMSSITNTDIENKEYSDKLLGHLKSDDFFGVENFPIAILKITKESQFNKGVAQVKADLMIKGLVHPIEFSVKMQDGSYIADVIVDRSKYDIRYGSRSFFDNLGDKAIHDKFTLEIELVID